MRNLDEHGIAHSGAGQATTKAAHKAALVEVGDVTVGLLGYDTIAPSYCVGARQPGQRAHDRQGAQAGHPAARARPARTSWSSCPTGASSTGPGRSAQQQRLGRAAIDAGADMVIGNHPHWAGAMEVYKDKPIWYALGNFVFDQTWSDPDRWRA